jgi:hypothetical protein
MTILNIISVALWLFVSIHGISAFRSMKDNGMSKREVTAITIVLLCGLNIAKDGLTFLTDSNIFTSGQKLTEYFDFGVSMFQLLLANFVLDHIQDNINNTKKQD